MAREKEDKSMREYWAQVRELESVGGTYSNLSSARKVRGNPLSRSVITLDRSTDEMRRSTSLKSDQVEEDMLISAKLASFQKRFERSAQKSLEIKREQMELRKRKSSLSQSSLDNTDNQS
jgi:hypothetical protein